MYDVTNNAPGPRTFQARSDTGAIYTATLLPGQTQTLDLVDPKHPAIVGMAEAGEIGLKSVKGKADAEPQEPKAVHRGGGSYTVMGGDVELVSGLSKEEAEAFNALDAAAKTAFVADRKS